LLMLHAVSMPNHMPSTHYFGGDSPEQTRKLTLPASGHCVHLQEGGDGARLYERI